MGTESSSSSSANYHVFLSFRGEDIRDNFISFLFKELSEIKKINTFIGKGIKKGERVSADRLNSIIEGSKISVIIFSEHYGDSKWCLDELVKILECKKRNGQIVIPVFYSVYPSDVKEQKGRFGKAFGDNAIKFKKNPEKVQKWRHVLKESSLLAGHESAKIKSDAKLVDVIVKDVSEKLEKIIVSNDTKGLIGIGSRINEVKSLLDIGKSDFRIVGIWGMGGIGKTTIAEALFNQISEEFESKFFMANVRENSKKVGLKSLQKEILSYLLEENLTAGGPNIPKYIKDKLRSKKVFIILDDVNKLSQLKYLAGGLDQFGSGSRVIITTRHKEVLDKFRVERVYQVRKLNHGEALKHFCNFAFSKKQCPEDLMDFSNKVLDFAKGNPLVIKVLGSFFYEKNKSDWKKAVRYLEQIPDIDAYSVLKVCYDELDKKLQNIFLDIACFFKGDNKYHLTSFLDDSYLRDNGLDVLVRKSLVTISENKLEMHDLLQEMGRKIVRRESEEDPGRRSRLWDDKDILRVLTKNKATNLIKGIFLDLSKISDHVDLDPTVFENMPNLRLLKFYDLENDFCNLNMSYDAHFYDLHKSYKVHLPQGLDYLPDELRYLHWYGYPLRTLPMRFNPKNLVELNLPYSKVEQLWYKKRKAYGLKSIDLHRSLHFTRIPDPSEIPKLERLSLSNCTKLPYILSSIQNFNYLGRLSLAGCRSLRRFPRNIHFSSPISIDLSCVNLTEFPQMSGNMRMLSLDRTAIEEVPSSIESLTYLQSLSLRSCKRLKILSTSICKLKSLYWLDLGLCSKLESFPEILEKMESLEHIGLECTKIRELPSSIENAEGLRSLNLNNCSELDTWPEKLRSLKYLLSVDGRGSGISQLPSSLTELHRLEELNFSRCRGLVLPPLSGLSSLQSLKLDDCGITEIPEDIGYLSSLEILHLDGNNFVSLPTSIKQLSRLRELTLRNCSMLESLPDLPPGLGYLDAVNCKQLQSLRELPPRIEDDLDTSKQCRCYRKFNLPAAMFLLDFRNCMKLKNILAHSQLKIQHVAVASQRRLLKEEEEEEEEHTRKPLVFSIRFPGSGIPEWFSNKSLGSSIQLCCSGNFIGFAVCVVIASTEVLRSREIDFFQVLCDYRFEITKPFSQSTCVHGNFQFWTSSARGLIFDSDHVCLGFRPRSGDWLPDGDHLTTISAEFSIVDTVDAEAVKVKCCGWCPIYANPMETKPKTYTVNMVPPTEEECRKLHVEAASDTSEATTESGSIDRLVEEEITTPQQQSSFLSQIFCKTRNLVVAGGLAAFAFGVYFYIKRAVSGKNELQVMNLKSNKTSKSLEDSKP
ncbi:Disease resistance protein (TIR-NBS-LRR class) family [Melia azedarach]|uniref:Disease resistance protein (TIR-NBS-LRR class) family n=1 Tax=Melia azedarach TaxID=155640 RepID=A0ACC1YK30_MELAZ|nr:Disease resistance protein (TIR-NBS-LRR class) family [Melia azedarach]